METHTNFSQNKKIETLGHNRCQIEIFHDFGILRNSILHTCETIFLLECIVELP